MQCLPRGIDGQRQGSPDRKGLGLGQMGVVPQQTQQRRIIPAMPRNSLPQLLDLPSTVGRNIADDELVGRRIVPHLFQRHNPAGADEV